VKGAKSRITMVGIGGRHLDEGFLGNWVRSEPIPFTRKWLKSTYPKVGE
jgi:hypothetical protein